MGNSCYQLQSQSMGTKTLDLNTDNFNIVEAEQQDNPQRITLSSKFLQTNICASNNLLNKTNRKHEDVQFATQIKIQQKKSLQKPNSSTSKLRKLPTIKINNQDFVEINKKPLKKKYKILQKIGEGTYGQVYKVQNYQTKDIRAVKIIKRCQFQKRKQEIQILKSCDHPNIIQVYEVFEEELHSYVVMQYCPGGSIINLIKNSEYQYHEDQARTILQQILHALVYLHQKGIVHRDIKLQNIVFMESRTDQRLTSNLKIIDFGTAQKMKFKVNKQNRIGGTTIYMPPQAFSGWYSRAFDVWSCGIILYILLSGCYPFKGKNKQEITQSIKNSQLAFSQSSWQRVSDEAKVLVKQMLTKDFIKRPTAKQCLQNKWFSTCIRTSQTKRASGKFMKNLVKYYAINNFVSVVQSYLSFSKMSKSQRYEIKKLFQALDVNRKGQLTKKDLMCQDSVLKQFDRQLVANLLQTADKNKSGSIQYSQFQAFMSNKQKLFIQSSLKEAFHHFDIDGSGFIQRNQLIACLKGCEGDVDVLIAEIDKNGDEKVSQQEFLEYFKNIQHDLNINDQA